MSRRNALKHGLLSKQLLIAHGEGKEDEEEYFRVLTDLREHLHPVGPLEEILVEKIAVEYWRVGRSILFERGLFRSASASGLEMDVARILDPGRDLSVMDRILRYGTSINRQLFQTMNQLERLQRQRKGEAVPAPISVDLNRET